MAGWFKGDGTHGAGFLWEEKPDRNGLYSDERKDGIVRYGPFGIFKGEVQTTTPQDDGGEVWWVE